MLWQVTLFHFLYTCLIFLSLCVYIYIYTHTQWNIIYLCVYIYISHIFIHSFVDGHSGSFHALAIVNGVAMKIKGHVAFGIKSLL